MDRAMTSDADTAVKVSCETPRPACHATGGDSDDLIELLFFAYRDFVGDPDRILAQYGFGRAHHRVLHFVDRYPGLTIAELLDILRITKQSLNRVLKDLIDQGYVEQQTGTSDRRQRLLFCTPSGRALTADLTQVQVRRIVRALDAPAEEDDGGRGTRAASAQDFLLAMIEPTERAAIRRLMARRATGRA
ncbi:MAG TPA: MarR family transcriptional regulator [Methylobacterium sp.]|uniref:MarR family winged helix-turn-helix transcriptional regulator n=1 Tax=Methylorubrum sp. B1-46 TaxID=2897334 RepID=UPI001E2D45BE|nr:MarR family transcriptional regulator [Methylorubrum sp. B1-46]UGB23868.1 MarR family transcriptional regulator [Methylorubrum sp. B1-46]HEV2544268.1 MarR family transcriptional regulator [Methylobacterium sp.]